MKPEETFLVRARRDWRGETWFGYWVSLPWRCKLFGHKMIQQEFCTDALMGAEEIWTECERCQTFGEYIR